MDILETNRLILRPFQITDLDDLYEYAKNPNVGPKAGWKPHESKDDSFVIINIFIESNEVWALVDKDTKKVIGSVGLHKDPFRTSDDAKMLGYVLAEEYWGRGLIVEASKAAINYAFKILAVNLLSVQHYTYNHQSKRVIEKCGFHYEGTLRQAAKIYNGSVYDVACYSMTKEEWINSNLKTKSTEEKL
jgi:putative acetyltransferase